MQNIETNQWGKKHESVAMKAKVLGQWDKVQTHHIIEYILNFFFSKLKPHLQ